MIGRVLVGLWVDIPTDRFLDHGMNLNVMAIIYATGLESLINNDIEAQEALMSLIHLDIFERIQGSSVTSTGLV